MSPAFGSYFREIVEDKDISKTRLCKEIGVSRPYLYAVFDGSTPPPVPSKQVKIADYLAIESDLRETFFELAAKERGEIPADIAAYLEEPSRRKSFREQYMCETAAPRSAPDTFSLSSSDGARLRVPCCYQGGKQRVAAEIVDAICEDNPAIPEGTRFYDLCCGSGAVSLEMINRGFPPSSMTMLDKSSWGVFWKAIGSGMFDMGVFKSMLDEIPDDKREVKSYMAALAQRGADRSECYEYIILQACSFGGKQIWREGDIWKNAFFRTYWEPTATSVRKSPANPMQPGPKTLLKRVAALAEGCRGMECIVADITELLDIGIPDNSIVYIDPPYRNTTGYAFDFDVDGFLASLRSITGAQIYISESIPLSKKAKRLAFRGAKGGISGNRSGKHEEWLSKIE